MLQQIDNEYNKLCSNEHPTIFRGITAKDLKHISLSTLVAELQKFAPTTWTLLLAIATSNSKYSRKTPQNTAECVLIAAAILLKVRCTHMSTVGYLIGLILWQGNASKKVSHICPANLE